jgi:hypothetical protein
MQWAANYLSTKYKMKKYHNLSTIRLQNTFLNLSKVVCYLGFSFFCFVGKSQTLHLLIVSETKKGEVFENLALDNRQLTAVKEQASTIAHYNHMGFSYKIGTTDFVSAAALASYFSELAVTDKDVILFYYSGHGLQDSVYSLPKISTETVAILHIYKQLQATKAGLKIMFADTGTTLQANHAKGYPRRQSYWYPTPIVRQVFSYAKGSLLIASGQAVSPCSQQYRHDNLFSICLAILSDLRGNSFPPDNWRLALAELKKHCPTVWIQNDITEGSWHRIVPNFHHAPMEMRINKNKF